MMANVFFEKLFIGVLIGIMVFTFILMLAI
jgi:hypothetical protein